MSSSAPDSNRTANGIALKSRKRAYLARALRSAPTLAVLSLWIALIGACGRSIFPEVGTSPTATPTITTSPITGNFLYNTNNTAGTISEFSRDLTSGVLSLVGTVAAGSAGGPVGIATGRAAKFVYAVNSADNQVRQYKVNLSNGALTPVGTGKIATGKLPQWIAITPNSNFAFVTNSTDASISPYTVNSTTGALTANGAAFQSTLLKKPWTAVATNTFLYVTDETKGTVVSFPIQADGTLGVGTSILLNAVGGPVAVPGPIIMNSAQSFVYVTDQANGLVYFLKVGSNGVLTLAASYASTGKGGSVGLAIATTSSGLNFLYVANQTANPPSITAFQIAADGTLAALAISQFLDPSLSLPTGVAVDPNGDFLYVANQGTGSITQFTINSLAGGLNFPIVISTGSLTNGSLYLSIAD
jgi:6-phosphogluconolactonase (cycloisomerase 2 family)